MKKLVSAILLAAFAIPILAGCGEASSDKVTSTNDDGSLKVDSKGTGKKGAMENDKGLSN